VLNRAPRGPRARAELTHSFGALLGDDGTGVPAPLQVADRRHLDEALRDLSALPAAWAQSVATPVRALLDRRLAEAAEVPVDDEPVAVRPGELGSWADEA
jgi:hypothetical protein